MSLFDFLFFASFVVVWFFYLWKFHPIALFLGRRLLGDRYLTTTKEKMNSYEIVPATSTQEAFENCELRIGSLARVTGMVASANANKTYTVRVTEVQPVAEDPFGTFLQDVDSMNTVFQTGFNEKPVMVGRDRMVAFHKNVSDEVKEILDATKHADDIEALTAFADTLGDLIVFCTSEARRWGIPIAAVLEKIMASQATKLVDGKPIYNEDKTKFIKGPHYVAPEGAIKEVLIEAGYQATSR